MYTHTSCIVIGGPRAVGREGAADLHPRGRKEIPYCRRKALAVEGNALL